MMLNMILIFSSLLNLVLWTKMLFILENVSYAIEKNMYTVAVGYKSQHELFQRNKGTLANILFTISIKMQGNVPDMKNINTS